jgi:hypothetical protein
MSTPSRPDLARRDSARTTYWICGLLAAAVVTLSALTQPSIAVHGGLGWDGAQYARLAGQCWSAPLTALEPFVYRIGTPCLAALVPASPRAALGAVNMAASVLLLFLLAAWLRRFVAPSIVPWLLIVCAFHWLGPLRYTWWYPAYIDPLALCALVGALLLVERPIALSVICAAGALVRETMIMVPLAIAAGRLISIAGRDGALGWRVVVGDERFKAALAGAAATGVAIAFAHSVVTPASDYWMLDSALHWAYTKSFPTYMLAWFIAFGPMLVLPVVSHKAAWRFLSDAPEYLVLLAAVAVLAWIGGTDTERFLWWAAPLVLAVVGIAAGAVDWRLSTAALGLLAAGQAINGRWFLLTPTINDVSERAWPILTPFRAGGFEQLLSQTPDRIASAAALIEYLFLAGLVAVLLRRRVA